MSPVAARTALPRRNAQDRQGQLQSLQNQRQPDDQRRQQAEPGQHHYIGVWLELG